jgi:hypothetical protein
VALPPGARLKRLRGGLTPTPVWAWARLRRRLRARRVLMAGV